MPYRDILLAALTYPDVTPDRALRSGVALAKRLGGGLTLLTVRVDIPAMTNVLANTLVQMDEVAVQAEARSARAALLEAACVRIAAEDADEAIRTDSVLARLFEESDAICQAARTRDITLLPIGPAVPASRGLAEATLFGSGRPILVYPEDREVGAAEDFDHVAVAWDGSARASRAVADALPLLRRATTVRIFTALGDKPQAVKSVAEDLVRHLATHGVAAILDHCEAQGQSIGHRLERYVATTRPDLLVMGGFGHSRIREFVLGGATQAVLEAPPCPVLMSH
ncbi:universal stress protein [uncultured Phenylobacterium sp.]|uniref:universal stress protein n=1 Tax=uncultured Phenylobacterium sp. TaxID=349273 RepID=UPI0025F94C33|nr:universal stress protein [uncultured Phenylobacterium sp.]